MGLDFSIGTPVGFSVWFSVWINEAPDKELIRHSIFILWAIWRARNDVLFKSV